MIDLYNEMLQKSIERQAKKIVSEGAMAQDRYGHLLDAFKDRDLAQEEADKINARISKLADSNKTMREERERASKEASRKIKNSLWDARDKDRKAADDFMNKHKRLLDKGRETVKREQNKTYFS